MGVALFIPTVLLEIFYIFLFRLTIKRPGFRFWPPPGARSWQFFTAWILASIVVVNGFFIGLLDFNSFILPHFWARLPVALAFLAPGAAIGTWTYTVFGLRSTLGLGNRLVTNGPYRYMRNPQCIGDSLNALAFIILTNSWMVMVVGLLGIALNLLAPFTEEPWLEERFGEAYLEYKKKVPRFFSKTR